MMRLFVQIATVVALCTGAFTARAEDRPAGAVTPVSITFMARGLHVSGPNKSATGHAFMVISVTTDSGTVSSAYGFYPKTGGMGVIKGPGMLRSEFRCSKAECLALEASAKEVQESVTVPATEGERRKVLELVDDYNGAKLFGPSQPSPEYKLLTDNCNAFVGKVAQALGYPIPSSTLPPTEYLASLKAFIKTEQERRSLERARRDRRDAEAELARLKEERLEQERQRREAEKRAAREKERLANEPPPPGWVECHCAAVHRQYGEYYRGVFYHPDGPRCPQ